MPFATLAIIGALAVAPQNVQVIRPDPNRASPTSWRFEDNREREIVAEWRRIRRELPRVTARDRVIAHRAAVADQLDRRIAAGDCLTARRIADQAGYADIREGVTRACEARAEN